MTDQRRPSASNNAPGRDGRRPPSAAPPRGLPGKLKPASPSRRAALAMLTQARDPKSPGLDSWLDEARSRGELSPQDAALAREIAYGVCRHRLSLERIVERYLHKPLPKQAWQVGECLLIGAYQALHLERVPAHSIVDESVRLVASARTEVGYRGLVNAIMRRIVKEERSRVETDPAAATWLVRHSVPDWLASEGGQVYRGKTNEAFFAASNEHAPLQLRVTGQAESLLPAELEDRLRGEIVDHTHSVPEIERGRHLGECLTIRGRGVAPEFLPSFRRGLVTAEDEGAQIAGWLAGAQEGQEILDLCASPGGKASHLLDIARRRARLVACDVSEQKLHRLRETIQRLGLTNITELRNAHDMRADAIPDRFDLVLVDAPCSGLGTLRRHPEIRWRRSARDLRSLARQQTELLDQAAPFVKPGGHLVYSLCTFTLSETDEVVDRFLASHPEFQPAPAPEGLPFDDTPFRSGTGRWRTNPHEHGCDAFYIARFQRV